MRTKIAMLIFSLSLSAGAMAEPYPTMETVRMVINCMQEIGGQSEETLYTCACRHDVITSQVSFHDYEEGHLYERYRNMSGEKGGIFRDAKDAKKLAARLRKVREEAAQACPVVKHIEAPSMKEGERVSGEE